MRKEKEGCPSRQEVAPHTTEKPQVAFYSLAVQPESEEP